MSKPVRNIDQISDEELEDCFDGSTDIEMVREIVSKCLDKDGFVNIEEFGHYFARAIEGFIDADETEDPDAWEEAWENNYEWGQTIAENINDSLSIEEPEEYN